MSYHEQNLNIDEELINERIVAPLSIPINQSDASLLLNNNNNNSNQTYSNVSLCGKDLNLTKSQLTTTVLLSLYFFLSSAFYSLLAPFFPAESLRKGISQTQVGLIFGIFEFVILILSPVFGKYVNYSLVRSFDHNKNNQQFYTV
jgi:hypothetical protein